MIYIIQNNHPERKGAFRPAENSVQGAITDHPLGEARRRRRPRLANCLPAA